MCVDNAASASAVSLERPKAAKAAESMATRSISLKRGVDKGLIPTLLIPFVPVVWLGPIGSRQFDALRSCAANTRFVACASLVPGAAVP